MLLMRCSVRLLSLLPVVAASNLVAVSTILAGMKRSTGLT